MQIKTVSAIMIWLVVALLLANIYFRLEWMFIASIALFILAVLIYFIPFIRRRYRESQHSVKDATAPH